MSGSQPGGRGSSPTAGIIPFCAGVREFTTVCESPTAGVLPFCAGVIVGSSPTAGVLYLQATGHIIEVGYDTPTLIMCRQTYFK